MRSRTFVAALVVVLVAAFAVSACGGDDEDAPALQGAQRNPPLAVGAVTLPDGTDEFTMRGPSGGLLVAYFGYTSCPDICPTTMSDIAVALRELPDDARERVEIAMVTVDPERDSAAILSDYLGHFFPEQRVHGLSTDDADALENAKDAFGVQSEVEAHEPGATDYEVAHTAITYVVDDAGTVLVEWPFGISSDAIASDLEVLLEEQT